MVISEENTTELKRIREEILDRVSQFSKIKNASDKFEPGVDRARYSGSIYDDKEAVAFVDSFLDGWFGLGKKGHEFEKKLSSIVGTKSALLINSGSSANLIAIATLCSKKTENRMLPGDEIIIPASSFPTTVNPCIIYGLVPVFVDCELGTYNVTPELIQKAITPKTRAIMFAHALGNPVEIDKIMQIAEENDLFVIEDTCDALGSTYDNKACGSFGTISTFSFYPAHHITMGGGGALLMNNLAHFKTCKSLRDWGRDCFCDSSEKSSFGACRKRFEWDFPNLPKGYDHKYVYSEIGFNLQPIEFQAAFGVEQLDKLDDFMRIRKENFKKMFEIFEPYQDSFILPKHSPKADPNWFAFPITIKENAKFNRHQFITFLGQKNIEARFLFTGNITRHPAYEDVNYRISGELTNSNIITERSMFLGVYPGLKDEHMNYIKKCVDEFMTNN